jgi:hypothetical protein
MKPRKQFKAYTCSGSCCSPRNPLNDPNGNNRQWEQSYDPTPDKPGNVDLILRRSLADRELLKHFQTQTAKALAMSKTIWEVDVFTAALKVR